MGTVEEVEELLLATWFTVNVCNPAQKEPWLKGATDWPQQIERIGLWIQDVSCVDVAFHTPAALETSPTQAPLFLTVLKPNIK